MFVNLIWSELLLFAADDDDDDDTFINIHIYKRIAIKSVYFKFIENKKTGFIFMILKLSLHT